MNWVKTHIPPRDRFYQEESWLIRTDHLFPFIRMALLHKSVVDLTELPNEVQLLVEESRRSWAVEDAHYQRTNAPAIEDSTLPEAYRTLYLQPDAPADIVDLVWRHLAKTHHPDKGGDASLFVRYSDAYRILRSQSDKGHS